MHTPSFVFVFVIIFSLYFYFRFYSPRLKCIPSKIDGETYCVREHEDKRRMQSSADLLAKVVAKCTQLAEYTKKKYGEEARVKRLVANFDPSVISETMEDDVETAYSSNKGEQIAFCLLEEKDNPKKKIDVDTLFFVAMHEMAHTMTSSVGHLAEFWDNFKFLLVNAEKAGIYDPVDYSKENKQYCSMSISDNPYFS